MLTTSLANQQGNQPTDGRVEIAPSPDKQREEGKGHWHGWWLKGQWNGGIRGRFCCLPTDDRCITAGPQEIGHCNP